MKIFAPLTRSDSSFPIPRSPLERGVALVVTLILLSVITFMAVAFLVISRSERGAVTTTTDQAVARLAADAALERFKAQVLGPFVADTNVNSQFNSYDLLVSTNYINRRGFFPGVSNPTNVNYDYVFNGAPLNFNERLQNLTNLFFDPRPPVFITNRAAANSMDFRFYLDLNRNRRYDTNGLLPLISPDPTLPYIATNGVYVANPLGVVSNFFVGDPEWVGGLEFPDRPHSAANPFVFRYAYIAIPVGRTLDINYVHNSAKQLSRLGYMTADGFIRNQGVGTWEMNLASFLVDLNTNLWPFAGGAPVLGGYQYFPSPGSFNRGYAFDDACSILRYRYAGRWSSLTNVITKFPGRGSAMFGSDGIDGYSLGFPLMTNTAWFHTVRDPDGPIAVRATGWSGSENQNHFYTAQELFDPAKYQPPAPINFYNRLAIAATNNDSYNRYTFYRMLSQIGTDSAVESPDRLNLNYVNVDGFSATNFVPWSEAMLPSEPGNPSSPLRPGSEVFFTNAVDRLLKQEGFSFGVNAIPVYTNGYFVYSPSMHRLLQVAANIYEATRTNLPGTPAYLPTVFRPIFGKPNNGALTIVDFKEFTGRAADLFSQGTVRDLDAVGTNGVQYVQPRDLVIGVPLIVAAKKGLPNFNEFAMQSAFDLTRKIQLTRPSVSSDRATWKTNVMYVLSVTNALGIEAWNSYLTNFPHNVDIFATNYASWWFTITNESGAVRHYTLTPTFGAAMSYPGPTNNYYWPGLRSEQNVDSRSFVVPFNIITNFIPESIYHYANNDLILSNRNATFESTRGFPLPQFFLNVSNRIVFMITDRATGRLIDYVHLNGLNNIRNLSSDMGDPSGTLGFKGLWATNRVRGTTIDAPPQGIVNQITICLNPQNDLVDWTSYGPNNKANGATKQKEIDGFRNFYNRNAGNTNLSVQVPFTPTRRVSQYQSFQANDPLVHYTAGDLRYLPRSSGLQVEDGMKPIVFLKNIGRVNDRYSPWGGNRMKTGGEDDSSADPNTFNIAVKDPGVNGSDYWDFPTNKFPNVGWLGRVHRGTPWQTVFLKATNILAQAGNGLKIWEDWTGNNWGDVDAKRSAPVEDRKLLEVFTAALSDSATHGQLSINQKGIAAWSALFGGVVTLQGDPKAGMFVPATNLSWSVIQPAGAMAEGTNTPLWRLVTAINDVRATNYGGSFKYLGDILSVPELTDNSPFLAATNVDVGTLRNWGIPDAVYEWLPQQVLGLLTCESGPRYLVYSYGQALKPADRSIMVNGPSQYFGLCTNYQITAEVATRAVVKFEKKTVGTNTVWQAVTENFNVLPPD